MLRTVVDGHMIEELNAVWPGNEGALFNNPNAEGMASQLEFIESVLLDLQPKTILEIGTNKGFFSYFCLSVLFGAVDIYTIDVEYFSSKACDIINDYFHNLYAVRFIQGKSQDVLKKWALTNRVDLIYIDGAHDYLSVKADLENSYRISDCPILIDDCIEATPDVLRATLEFCSDRFYSLSPVLENDDRGLRLLKYIGRDDV